MSTQAFREWKPQGKTEHLLNASRRLLEEEPRMTVRHLFFRLVEIGVLDDRPQDLKRLVRVTTEARMAGLLDWDFLGDTDPGRVLQRGTSGVEVWIERDSLLGLTCTALADLDVTIVRFHAYPSSAVLYDAGQRGAQTIIVPVSGSERDDDIIEDLVARTKVFGPDVNSLCISVADDIEKVSVSAYVQILRAELGVNGVN